MTKLYVVPMENPGMKFPLGHTSMTVAAAEKLSARDLVSALTRHASGDWGDVSDADREENELSLKHGYRLLSVYHTADGTKFWIITEADRMQTTVLLPEDY